MNSQLRAWRMPTLITCAAIVIALALYGATALSMVAIWQRSETYTHGFLIFPISLYMIWHHRESLIDLAPQPNYWLLPILLGLGFIWLLSDLADVLVAAQYALVAAIPVMVAVILGPRVVRRYAFAFAFMLFAVPFGEIFIPTLINFTADFTVLALKLTGIPVFREGNLFSIPSGNWSVVDACSGLRYLIASFTLGSLYAYLTYRSLRRKLLFVAASLIVPILANGMRAYMIVMIGHLSGMKYAVGVDHLIYGWVFFGLVMLLLFWLGSYWREDHLPAPPRVPATPSAAQGGGATRGQILSAAIAALLAFGMWPVLAAYLDRAPHTSVAPQLNLPSDIAGWQASDAPLSTWTPSVFNAATRLTRTYQRGTQSVQLSIYYYRAQTKGKQMVSSQNVMANESDKDWTAIGESARHFSAPPLDVLQTRLHGPRRYLLTWHWYWLADRYLTNPYRAKMLQAREKLLGHGDDGAIIILAAPYEDSPQRAGEALEAFARDALPTITDILQKTKAAQ